MVTTLTICFVDPEPIRIQAFIWAHLPAGLWSILAREYYQNGFRGVRIFGSHENPSMFVLVATWASNESLEAAKQTPAYPVLDRFQSNLTLSRVDCGAIGVPLSRTSERGHQDEFARADVAATVINRSATTPMFDAEARRCSDSHTRTDVRLQPVEALYEVSSIYLDIFAQRALS